MKIKVAVTINGFMEMDSEDYGNITSAEELVRIRQAEFDDNEDSGELLSYVIEDVCEVKVGLAEVLSND